MPITCCEHCGRKMLIGREVEGQIVGCLYCNRTFRAARYEKNVSGIEILLVLIAIAAFVVLTILYRNGQLF